MSPLKYSAQFICDDSLNCRCTQAHDYEHHNNGRSYQRLAKRLQHLHGKQVGIAFPDRFLTVRYTADATWRVLVQGLAILPHSSTQPACPVCCKFDHLKTLMLATEVMRIFRPKNAT